MIIEIEGQKYELQPLSLKNQHAFEDFMRFHELDAIKNAKEELDPEDYYTLLRLHIAERGKACKVGSDHFYEVIRNRDNAAELLWYCLTIRGVQEPGRMLVERWIANETDEVLAILGGLMDSREREDELQDDDTE